MQDFASLGRRMGGDEVFDVSFETDHLLVPSGQGAAGDEDAADVLDDLAFGEFVQGFVSERAVAGAEVGKDGGDDAAGEPARPAPSRSPANSAMYWLTSASRAAASIRRAPSRTMSSIRDPVSVVPSSLTTLSTGVPSRPAVQRESTR